MLLNSAPGLPSVRRSSDAASEWKSKEAMPDLFSARLVLEGPVTYARIVVLHQVTFTNFLYMNYFFKIKYTIAHLYKSRNQMKLFNYFSKNFSKNSIKFILVAEILTDPSIYIPMPLFS